MILIQFKENMETILIQTVKWVMQPKVWRLIGFTSSIIGLLSYALSSSFNYLFGNWNLFKIFLYSIFSSIISLMILFATKWKHSPTLHFKAHAAYFVLTLTSVYSFFFDKVVNGKPDAYSLISCASFAIMSLSLSRQTQCGFEVDLLYFFLGCLIVQLMKIKLQLFIVGAILSYFIIILRSCLSSLDVVIVSENPRIQDENLVVIEVHSHSSHLPSSDISSNLMEQLGNCMKALQHENSNLVALLLEKLKDYLSDDPNFEGVLRQKEISDLMIDALPTETIDNLHKIAKSMAGFEKDFSDVYNSYRREWLEETLSKLGFQKLGIEVVKILSWEEIEDKVERWIKVSIVALKILFPTERRLCDRVFFGFSSAADLLFMDICRDSTLQLLYFTDDIAITSRAPERLFKVLDMYETMRDLIPEFESLFCDQYSGSLRNEVATIWKRLGEAIRGIFIELENLIRHDPVTAAIPGGGLHPMTRYVMSYLQAASWSQQTLEQVFEDYGQPLKEFPKIDDRMHSSSSLSVQMGWIMELLESNLEAKTKIYKYPALCCVFFMNNCSYMVQKIEDSEMETILGDVVIQKYTAKIRQHREDYQRSSWNKVLEFLELDSYESMIENLKSFNVIFAEICRVQSKWFIFDEQLREEVRISIEKLLLPAYRNFIGRFHSVHELSNNADRYIKYGMEDIEAKLHDLFQGNSGSNGSRN